MSTILAAAAAMAASPICGDFVHPAVAIVLQGSRTEANEFYRKKLGFHPTFNLGDVGREQESFPLTCRSLQIEWGDAADQRQVADGRHSSFDIVAVNFDGALELVRQNEIPIVFGPAVGIDGIQTFAITDPNGNRISIHDRLGPFQPATNEEPATKIAARAKAFSATYVAGDIDALMDFYTEGGVGMPGARTPMVGREALHRYWRVPEGVEVIDHETVSEDLRIEGNVAIDRGTYRGSSRRNGEVREFTGRYLVVWTRGEDGLWRMSEDMWASN